MDPLSVLAELLAIGKSLYEIFGPDSAVDDTKLAEAIVAQLQIIIHAEITQNDIVISKSVADTIIDDLNNKYLTAVQNGESAKGLADILDSFNVLGTNTGSPLAQANMMVEICKEPATSAQTKQQAVSIYLLLSTLILSILQEKTRQMTAQQLAVKGNREEITKFAKEFSTNATKMFTDTVSGRIALVQYNVDNSDVPYRCYQKISDSWLQSPPVIMVDIYPVEPSSDLCNPQLVVIGYINDHFPGIFPLYTTALEKGTDTEALNSSLTAFPLFPGGYEEYTTKISYYPPLHFYGDALPSLLLKEISNFQNWRMDTLKTISAIQSITTNPMGINK